MHRNKKLLIALAIVAVSGCAEENLPEHSVVLENHQFTPAEITVPVDQKFRLKIDNRDDAAEEFESDSLGREKVVPGKTIGSVVLGPLKPGRYPFVGEYHPDTAKGAVIAQ